MGEGGLSFALSTDLHYRSNLSIPSLQAGQLGGISGRLTDILTGGSAAGLGNNTSEALRIVEEALGQIDMAEGTVDGFYNSSIATSNSLLDDLQTDLEDAISATDGYNEDEENVLLAKNQGARLKCPRRIGDNDSAASGHHRPDQAGSRPHLIKQKTKTYTQLLGKQYSHSSPPSPLQQGAATHPSAQHRTRTPARSPHRLTDP